MVKLTNMAVCCTLPQITPTAGIAAGIAATAGTGYVAKQAVGGGSALKAATQAGFGDAKSSGSHIAKTVPNAIGHLGKASAQTAKTAISNRVGASNGRTAGGLVASQIRHNQIKKRGGGLS